MNHDCYYPNKINNRSTLEKTKILVTTGIELDNRCLKEIDKLNESNLSYSYFLNYLMFSFFVICLIGVHNQNSCKPLGCVCW